MREYPITALITFNQHLKIVILIYDIYASYSKVESLHSDTFLPTISGIRLPCKKSNIETSLPIEFTMTEGWLSYLNHVLNSTGF